MRLTRLSTAWLLFSAARKFVAAHGAGFRIRSPPSQDEMNVHFGEGEAVRSLPKLQPLGRQSSQACGVGVGSCPAGQCCSAGGLCGTGTSYCEGPDCQLDYGPACDGK